MPGQSTPQIVMSTTAPVEVYNARVFFIATIASMGAILFGYDLAFIGTTITLPAFERDFDLKNASQSTLDDFSANVVSLLQAGCFLGAIVGPVAAERWGRKPLLLTSGIVFCAGSLMQTLSFGIWAVLYSGRLIGGLGVGAASALVPLYIAELSPPSIRGMLVGMYEVSVQTGTCIGFWICYGVKQHLAPTATQWITPFVVQLIPGGLLIVGMFFVPESPRWQAKHCSYDVALKGLALLRNLPEEHPYVVEEMAQVMTHIDQTSVPSKDKHGRLRQLFRPDIRRRIFIVVAIFIFMQFAGSNAINYYSPRVFKSIGLEGDSASLLAVGIYGIVRLVAVIIAMLFVVDRFGRRKMLIAGSAVMGVSMWYLGAYTKISPATTSSTVSPGGYAAATFIYIYAIGFCFSMAAIPWIYCAEIFPAQFRGTGMAIGSATHWLLNFVIARSSPYMFTNIQYGTYFVFATCISICAPFVYFCVPETKGLSLEQMDLLFGYTGTGASDVDADESTSDSGIKEIIETIPTTHVEDVQRRSRCADRNETMKSNDQ